MRLGDLDALKEKLKNRYENEQDEVDKGWNLGIGVAINLIDNAPTVEYTFEEAFQKTVCEQRLYCPQRPQGEWEITRETDEFYGLVYKCTHCGKEVLGCGCRNFCTWCGASMTKEVKKNEID